MSNRNYKAMGDRKLLACYHDLDGQPAEDRDVITSLAIQRGLIERPEMTEFKPRTKPAIRVRAGHPSEGLSPYGRSIPVKPMLAFDLSTRVNKATGENRIVTVPEGGDWMIEPKYDGIRLMVHMTEQGIRVYGGRNGSDHTGNQPKIEHVLAQLPVDTVLDGELVHGAGKHLDMSNGAQMYVVFDVLRLNGTDVRSLPFRERRQLLEEMNNLEYFDGENVQMTPQLPCRQEVYEELVRLGWEGGMAKNMAAPYRSGKRSRDLLKLKPQWTDEAVVIGYEMGKGESNQTKVGALNIRMLETGAETSVGFGCEVGEVFEHVGKICEIAHFGLFADTGKPRHPGFVRWRPDRDPA